jgi:hypothetical protein
MGFGQTLKKLDIFGGQRGLTFGGEEKHKTLVGAVLTILYLLIIVFFFLLYYNDYTNRWENPIVNSKKLIKDNSPTLIFHNNRFFFTVALLYQDVYVKPEEIEKILNITVLTHTSKITDQSIVDFDITNTKLVQCNNEHFKINDKLIVANPERSPSIFSLCLEVDEQVPEQNYKIDGEFNENGKSYLQLVVKPCEGTGCRVDLVTILDAESLRVVFGSIEVSINQDDKDEPFNYHFNSEREFSLFNKKTYVRKLHYEQNQVKSDIGTFQELWDLKNSMNFKQEMNEDKDRSLDNEPYLELYLYSSNDVFEITRNYEKIQDTLAKVGGMVTIVSLGMAVVYQFYNKISLKLEIMNQALLADNEITHSKINFFQVMKFIFCKIFSVIGCRKCFSEETHKLTTMYFNADERVHSYLEVKAIVNNTRDVKLFRRIFFNKYQKRLLQKIENDTLFVETEHHYLDEETEDIEYDKAVEYVKQHRDVEDDVDRRINSFFFKLHEKIEELKKASEAIANEGKLRVKARKRRGGPVGGPEDEEEGC